MIYRYMQTRFHANGKIEKTTPPWVADGGHHPDAATDEFLGYTPDTKDWFVPDDVTDNYSFADLAAFKTYMQNRHTSVKFQKDIVEGGGDMSTEEVDTMATNFWNGLEGE